MARRRDLTTNLVAFCRLLRAEGFSISSSEQADALRALAAVDIGDRAEVRLALRSVVTSRAEEVPRFDALFATYWGNLPLSPAEPEVRLPLELSVERTEQEVSPEALLQVENLEGRPREAAEVVAASAHDVPVERDFAQFAPDELPALANAIERLARRLASLASRRMRAARRGPRVDLRRSMRRSVRYGGELVVLARRTRRVRRARLVLLCDVSRSMDQYSRLLLQFVYAFQHVRGRVESFVFGTSLTRATPFFQEPDVRAALDRLAHEVPDWSGGTRIGASLLTFLDDFHHLLSARTTVIILSDGVDSGDPALLEEAMRRLRHQARTIIWLNPLLGRADFEPSWRGMAAALPYVDVFASAHNLRSLEELERHLGP